jgi:ATP-dependent RNA helicase RhlE
MGFTVFKFNPRIDAGIRALGFTAPTPIQAKAIPPVLAGRDVLGLAQTGTGKTAAFVLPILERLIDGPRHTLRALILAPTRELAEQIHDVIHLLTPHTGIRSITVYGGVGMQPQVEKLRAGVDIVVACPGRLLDHFSQRTINVSKLEVLVIDEADRMFDMGFLKDLRKVIAYLPKKRQTLLFSATMADEIRRLIHDVLVNPETVQIGHSAPAATVDHALYPVPQHLKTPLLIELLRKTGSGSVLVFTRTKHRAKKVARTLAREGFSSAELQGNLSQNQRQNALDGFRDGRYQVLVATDIAARGIDVSTISHVINYDIPDTTDAYTHRIGRTGRMERGGDAFTFVTDEDRDTVRAIERVLNAPIERRTLEGFDYRAAAPKKDTEFARDPRPHRGAPHAKPASHGHAKPAHGRTPGHAKPAPPAHPRSHGHAKPAAPGHATHGRTHAHAAPRTGSGWKSGPGTAAAKPRGRRLLKRSGR